MALQLLKNGTAVGSNLLFTTISTRIQQAGPMKWRRTLCVLVPWSSSQLQSYNPYLQIHCHQTLLCSASVACAWSIVERIPSVFEHVQDEIHLS